jgi:hypothetical protein
MRQPEWTRREFARAASLAALGSVGSAGFLHAAAAPSYRGPNVVIVRFGGGVRRKETIEPDTSYAPFLARELIQRGVLLPAMSIAQLDGVETSHAEGTINILTGRYRAYADLSNGLFDQRLRPTVPTLFEAVRQRFAIPVHQVLMINGEDRQSEDFLLQAGHKHTGVDLPGEVLGLSRFKMHKLTAILADRSTTPEQLEEARQELSALLQRNNLDRPIDQAAPIDAFWHSWRQNYGDSGLVNARGDRLLTQLALAAMARLQPRLMMICYQDTDYVHWGNASHYTRAISIIDDGLRQIVTALEQDPFYRDNTVLCVVPDCGRDTNPLMDVPFQHHFGTRAAHEIWALFVGIGAQARVGAARRIDGATDQSAIAPTLAAAMGLTLPDAEGRLVEAVLR